MAITSFVFKTKFSEESIRSAHLEISSLFFTQFRWQMNTIAFAFLCAKFVAIYKDLIIKIILPGSTKKAFCRYHRNAFGHLIDQYLSSISPLVPCMSAAKISKERMPSALLY